VFIEDNSHSYYKKVSLSDHFALSSRVPGRLLCGINPLLTIYMSIFSVMQVSGMGNALQENGVQPGIESD
jgi:hypothetical protein